MAAVAGEIDIEHLAKVNLDLTSSSWDDTIFQEVLEKLPSYARPVFLRRVSSLDITGTYKLKKRELQSEGCDPSKISDPLFLLHPQTRYPLLSDSLSLLFFSFRKYVPLDSSLYQEVEEGKIRLWILFHPSESTVLPRRSWRTLLKTFWGTPQEHSVTKEKSCRANILSAFYIRRKSNPRKQCCDLTLVETLWLLHIIIVVVLLTWTSAQHNFMCYL